MLINIKKLINPNIIEVVHVNLPVKNLPKEFEGIKVVQISDLHVNDWSINLVEEVIAQVNNLHADIVLITGDVICRGKRHLPDLAYFFKKFNATMGKFACLGNHDHSDGESGQRVAKMYDESGFRLLLNESEKISIKGQDLFFAGVDDYDFGIQDINRIKLDLEEGAPKILLAHNPRNFEEFAENSFNSVISGHTHGGQIYLPFMNRFYRTILGASYLAGLYHHDDSVMYVNRGIGTAMISQIVLDKKLYFNTPRINATPEITVFTLVPNYS